jgi:hypothetical protein
MKITGWELLFWVLGAVLLWFVLFLVYQEMQECEKAGGVMVRTQTRAVCIDAKALK